VVLYNLPAMLPQELQVLCLGFSGHIKVGKTSMQYTIFV
jgi:hypothetical protein